MTDAATCRCAYCEYPLDAAPTPEAPVRCSECGAVLRQIDFLQEWIRNDAWLKAQRRVLGLLVLLLLCWIACTTQQYAGMFVRPGTVIVPWADTSVALISYAFNWSTALWYSASCAVNVALGISLIGLFRAAPRTSVWTMRIGIVLVVVFTPLLLMNLAGTLAVVLHIASIEQLTRRVAESFQSLSGSLLGRALMSAFTGLGWLSVIAVAPAALAAPFPRRTKRTALFACMGVVSLTAVFIVPYVGYWLSMSISSMGTFVFFYLVRYTLFAAGIVIAIHALRRLQVVIEPAGAATTLTRGQMAMLVALPTLVPLVLAFGVYKADGLTLLLGSGYPTPSRALEFASLVDLAAVCAWFVPFALWPRSRTWQFLALGGVGAAVVTVGLVVLANS